MSNERICAVVVEEFASGQCGWLLVPCGLPLVPDETSPCVTGCGQMRFMDEHEPEYAHYHAYVASRLMCSAGHTIVA